MTEPKDPSASIIEAHARALSEMPFGNTQDFADADRGFIAPTADRVMMPDGRVAWDAASYDFIAGEAPTSVHPSLWRQSMLTAKHGLYEVVPGIYQVRGLDLSNITFIESDSGVMVLDPLITEETAAAGLALYREHRGDRPVVGVIFTHSHLDHFGGVFGVTTQEDIDAEAVAIIAPADFVEHSVAENVYAGTAMSRRAGYMYGAVLERGPRGAVGAGLGQTTSSGTPGIAAPTITVATTGEKHTVDGVEMEFQMAPGTEAPSEMHVYFPRYRAFCIAENATHTMHNLLTLRGALVRDPHVWSGYLTEAIELFADRSDVMFSPHHWPAWGKDRVRHHLEITRDVYAYLHDQTLRMLNQGMTGAEIAEVMTLPPALEAEWGIRGYYGSVSHNVKAIYQRYMGWFDGNPARLWPHPPAALAARYVDAMGGIDRVVELAQAAFDAGDYRWAATLLDHAIFVDKDHAAARELYADTLEQLGYGSENGTWRNFFLSGATELRSGSFGTPTATNAPTIMAQLSPSQLLDAIAIQVDGPKAWDLDLAFDLTLTDLGVNYHVTLRNGVLIYVEKAAPDHTPLKLTLTKTRLLQLIGGDRTSPGIDVDGDMGVIDALLGVLSPGDPDFEIVLP